MSEPTSPTRDPSSLQETSSTTSVRERPTGDREAGDAGEGGAAGSAREGTGKATKFGGKAAREQSGMDIPRKAPRSKKRYIYGALALAALIGITYYLSTLERAAPTVDRATVWVDTVQRGEMLRQVRAAGNLVPEQIYHVAAESPGRVVRMHHLPGVEVEPGTVLAELTNPDLQLALDNAEQGLLAADANYENLQAELQSQLMSLQSQAATVEADYESARLQADREQELFDEGLTSELNLNLQNTRAQMLARRHELEQQRLDVFRDSMEARLAAERATVEQRRSEYARRRNELEQMTVRAGVAGVLREMDLEVGQRVNPGDTLAVIVQPEHLKAELRVDQTQAKDIVIGQPARVDTRNGVVPGRVARIDPAVQDGVVRVDVELLADELPAGARPDLAVDGTIEIERLDDVLYVGRPAYGQSEQSVGLFKLTEDESHAVRATVQLGRSSVNTIEIRGGLEEGDQVILSDMSRWDGVDRVRLR